MVCTRTQSKQCTIGSNLWILGTPKSIEVPRGKISFVENFYQIRTQKLIYCIM